MRCASVMLGSWVLLGVAGCGTSAGADGPGPAAGLGCDDATAPTRTISCVEAFAPGAGAGWGAEAYPDNIYGEAHGGGLYSGAQPEADVLSLGAGGEIVVGFGASEIVDGPGADFIVFENAFYITGTEVPFEELAEVSVSDDGQRWETFPCAADELPYLGCAGWHPVLANREQGISSFDPAVAGGDAFDLADIGVGSARFVRIRDLSDPDKLEPEGKAGFDLDAVAIVNVSMP